MNLESVQEFYKIIGEEPRNATMKEVNLLDFCNQSGHNEVDYYPVLRLRYEDSNGEAFGHAVVLSDYTREADALFLFTIDSSSKNGESFLVQCPIILENGRPKLKIRDRKDKWCLGSEYCYFFQFN